MVILEARSFSSYLHTIEIGVTRKFGFVIILEASSFSFHLHTIEIGVIRKFGFVIILVTSGFFSHLHTIEIGGYWEVGFQLLKRLFGSYMYSSVSARMMLDKAACKVIGASQTIFNARLESIIWTAFHDLLWNYHTITCIFFLVIPITFFIFFPPLHFALAIIMLSY